MQYQRFLLLFLFWDATSTHAGCDGGGVGGCEPPRGQKWNRWDMAGSTYTYCYNRGCPVDWFIANNYTTFAGVVGVDHYWTKQGMPCINGEPQEFAMQKRLALSWKKSLTGGLRFLTYRILTAVPYDMVIRNQMVSRPDYFVRWLHLPGSQKPGNGSICYNYLSGCFNDPKRINNPAHKCSFEIRAAAYDWKKPEVRDWYVDKVIAPTVDDPAFDGLWLDGNGPDNGAWMCAGICCGYGAHNSPHNQTEIDAQCAGEMEVATRARRYVARHQGIEVMGCSTYLHDTALPSKKDAPQTCARKIRQYAAWAANHSNYNQVIAYGDRTATSDYTPLELPGYIAAFLLMRGEHWFLSLAPTKSLSAANAALLTSDYGAPKGPMTAVNGSDTLFQRAYERATVRLDCDGFRPSFDVA